MKKKKLQTNVKVKICNILPVNHLVKIHNLTIFDIQFLVVVDLNFDVDGMHEDREDVRGYVQYPIKLCSSSRYHW